MNGVFRVFGQLLGDMDRRLFSFFVSMTSIVFELIDQYAGIATCPPLSA